MAGEDVSTPAPEAPLTPQAAKAADALQTIVEVAQNAAPPAVPSTRFSFKGYSPWTVGARSTRSC